MNKKKRIVITSLIVISIITISFIKINSNDMNKLPTGEFIKESISPSGQYTIKTYLCNGGSTVDYAIRGELINLKTDKIKNIYWDYHVDKSDIKWENNNLVIINSHKINIPNGIYDWRKDKN